MVANPGAEARAFHEFITPTRAAAPPAPGGGGAPHKPGVRPAPAPPPGVFADVEGGKQQAATLGNVGIPVYFPRVLAAGSQYCLASAGDCPAETTTVGSYPRAYLIHDRAGGTHPSYRMTVALNPAQGEYYGVQGTAWLNPPILSRPTATRMVSGKVLLLYFNGHKLSLAAWRTPQGVYWISNTLTDSLSSSQMIAIAGSLTRG